MKRSLINNENIGKIQFQLTQMKKYDEIIGEVCILSVKIMSLTPALKNKKELQAKYSKKYNSRIKNVLFRYFAVKS